MQNADEIINILWSKYNLMCFTMLPAVYQLFGSFFEGLSRSKITHEIVHTNQNNNII